MNRRRQRAPAGGPEAKPPSVRPGRETYRWNVHDDRHRDFWGNAVVESWHKETTPVLDLDGRLQPVSGSLPDESSAPVGADGLG
ncbi:hypothetical protein [Streptomyces griseoruber]|uniref:hypothetical protein n=1 Tax=Streptomyces griseoruber TaxID=1943 RepID=UPI000B080023|nr:hypothetical protein [Streptomyces griseoruber]